MNPGQIERTPLIEQYLEGVLRNIDDKNSNVLTIQHTDFILVKF
mgnify:CR=1 FL=1